MIFGNKTISIFVICCQFLIGASISSRAAGFEALTPSDVTDNPAKFWGVVMEEFYGPYDKSLKCWVGETMTKEGEELLCMRPHKLVSADVNDKKHHFIAMGGFALNDQNERDECHACSGRVGFVILEDGISTLSIITKNSLGDAMGSWGSIPAEEAFSLRKIGKDAAYGWVVDFGYTGQGYTYLGAYIYGATADNIQELGFIPTGFNDEGNCEAGKNISNGNPCSDYLAEIDFVETDGTTFHTARLKHSGTYRGDPMNEIIDIPFDNATSTYKVPETLPRD